ncbi:hypothetical protein Tco_0792667 [Tanacetum coccineum]
MLVMTPWLALKGLKNEKEKVWKSVRYGVSKELDTAYWGFLRARIRRIFLDGYDELVVAEVAAEAPTQVPKQPGHPRQQRSILSYSKWALAANIGMPLLGPMATQGLCIFNLNTILQPNSSAISLIGMPRAITLSILPVSY